MKLLTLLPVLLCLGSLSPPALGSPANENAKIALHLQDVPTGKAPNICDRAERPPCNSGEQNLRVNGQLHTTYNVYALVLDGDAQAGISGADFGVSYSSSILLNSWTLCADLSSPQETWPQSDSGIIVTWNALGNCQDTPAVGDSTNGVTAVLGSFYVYAYSEGVLSISPRTTIASQEFAVSDCSPQKTTLPFPSSAGSVAFGNSATGYDPCAADQAAESVQGGIYTGQWDRRSSRANREVVVMFKPGTLSWTSGAETLAISAAALPTDVYQTLV